MTPNRIKLTSVFLYNSFGKDVLLIKKTFWFFVFNWGTLDIGKSNDNMGYSTLWGVLPHGVSCPMGCPTLWGVLSYGVSYPMGCPTQWGVLPNGVFYPMGCPTQWGVLPNGVSYPMGFPTQWGFLPNGVSFGKKHLRIIK